MKPPPWFVTALHRPELAPLITDIQAVCKAADRLHRTVSCAKAEDAKHLFLKQLRKIVQKAGKTRLAAARVEIERLVKKSKKAISRINGAPAENSKDWRPAVRLAQVQTNHTFLGKRGFQGGAPQ